MMASLRFATAPQLSPRDTISALAWLHTRHAELVDTPLKRLRSLNVGQTLAAAHFPSALVFARAGMPQVVRIMLI